ncbi:unnamed protein product [Brugia pahangi]|uniref:Uncharacterized protein n=1 Tax=Brugia pahangi TaxID=6280 RepID=A0A0N4TZX1_BRUPA|nr:unnamed protein product [Brugia pahangi]
MSLGSERRWVGNYRLRQYAVNPPVTTAISKERLSYAVNNLSSAANATEEPQRRDTRTV